MSRSTSIVAGALVAALSFALGWLAHPGFRFTALPEMGALHATGRPCQSPAGAPVDPAAIINQALRYSPGDSAGVQALVLRRSGANATLITLEGQLPDDEVAAEGKEYEMEWKNGGWTIAACRTAVRYQPGRP